MKLLRRFIKSYSGDDFPYEAAFIEKIQDMGYREHLNIVNKSWVGSGTVALMQDDVIRVDVRVLRIIAKKVYEYKRQMKRSLRPKGAGK